MNRIKRNIVLVLCCCLGVFPTVAQTAAQAKILFEEGKYAEALPAYENFAKKNPANASYNYYLGACLYELNKKGRSEAYLKKAAGRGLAEAERYLGKLYADYYSYDEAVSCYEKFLEGRKKKKLSVAEFEKEYATIKMGAQMLKGTEQVQFVDSMVVDKKTFLNSYSISQESGLVTTYASYFNQPDSQSGILYQTELGNKIWFGKQVGGHSMQLFTSDRIDGKWSEAQQLSGLEEPEGMNYPYVLADGITLYYAAKGDNSLGGYDIFVTRLNSETNQYLKPENIGMPFNSPANDYMYVVDEFNNLGWFATDRNQSEGKVCIYLFIPNESRVTYDFENTPLPTIIAAAKLSSISRSQTDKNAIREAKQRLAFQLNTPRSQEKKADFTFVIDDLSVYHQLSDFRKAKAKSLFQSLQQARSEQVRLSQYLQKKRDEYAKGGSAKQLALKSEILDAEKKLEQMEEDIDKREIAVRNEELKTN